MNNVTISYVTDHQGLTGGRIMKKILAIVLTLVMTLCIFGSCFAESTENLYEAYGRELKLNPADSLNGQYAGQKLTVFCATGEFQPVDRRRSRNCCLLLGRTGFQNFPCPQRR